MYELIAKEYEKKLKELMSEKEFTEFAADVARKLFKQELEGMKDGEFKDFALANFDAITK